MPRPEEGMFRKLVESSISLLSLSQVNFRVSDVTSFYFDENNSFAHIHLVDGTKIGVELRNQMVKYKVLEALGKALGVP